MPLSEHFDMLETRLSSIRLQSMHPLLIELTERRNADSDTYLGSRISDCIRWSSHLTVLMFLQFSSHIDGFAVRYPRALG